MTPNQPRIVIVVGPTATGKSDIAVALALRFNGEVISADSRQVYRGMNLGTGKITPKEMKGVPHHLLDIRTPARRLSAHDYARLAHKKVEEVIRRGKVPILCGGTGFYIDAFLYGGLPEVPPNPTLRKRLERLSTAELSSLLRERDPERFATIDPHNKVRVIRALEIVHALGKVPPRKKESRYNALWIGLDIPETPHKKRIEDRVRIRMKKGMKKEGEQLIARYGSTRIKAFGLEYEWLTKLIEENITLEECIEGLVRDITSYAKRQRTWFAHAPVTWFSPNDEEKIVARVNKFLTEENDISTQSDTHSPQLRKGARSRASQTTVSSGRRYRAQKK